MPKVSIIIPTLNRAHLLKHAIKSAIDQDYEDLEIVVCDDCSDDNTKEVVDSFNSEKIIYAKPDNRLNMTDIFEFGFLKASGEYLIFPTDACYLVPNCISYALKKMEENNVKLAMWGNCVYCYKDWMEKVRGNHLQVPKFTFKTYLLESKNSLKKFYDNIREPIIPKSLNSLCHRSIIEKAVKIQGRFFSQPIPDHTSGATMLANTDKFIFIDRPLFLGSLSSSNIGASQSFNLGNQAQNFLKSFPGKKIEEIVFLGIYNVASLIIKGLQDVKKFYPDCSDINIKNALFEVVDSTAKLQVYGVNVKNYWQTINDYVAKNCKELRGAILIKKIKSFIKWRGAKIIRSNSLFYNLESILRGIRILKGEKVGFNDIEGAAKIVEKLNKE